MTGIMFATLATCDTAEAGPGTYPRDRLVATGSSRASRSAAPVYATRPDSTTGKVTTDSKGGGSWTFTRLAPAGSPGETISGTGDLDLPGAVGQSSSRLAWTWARTLRKFSIDCHGDLVIQSSPIASMMLPAALV